MSTPGLDHNLNFDQLRENMVRDQLQTRQIRDPYVLHAMRTIQRHRFVPENMHHLAYRDSALPIGHDQTITQPYVTAFMLESLMLTGFESVLEIGTGSGYQTALLSQLARVVISIERNATLAAQAVANLAALTTSHDDQPHDPSASVPASVPDISNVEIFEGDGSQGLPDMSPFDRIIVCAAAPAIPPTLMYQLADGGILVIPVGNRDSQHLARVQRKGDRWDVEYLLPVAFVPLIGRHGFGAPRLA